MAIMTKTLAAIMTPEIRAQILFQLDTYLRESVYDEDLFERWLESRYNALLARIPSYGYGGKVKYLDAGRRFLGAGGEIPRALMPDLFHPSDEGYAIIARELEPYLAPLREKSRSEGVW